MCEREVVTCVTCSDKCNFWNYNCPGFEECLISKCINWKLRVQSLFSRCRSRSVSGAFLIRQHFEVQQIGLDATPRGLHKVVHAHMHACIDLLHRLASMRSRHRASLSASTSTQTSTSTSNKQQATRFAYPSPGCSTLWDCLCTCTWSSVTLPTHSSTHATTMPTHNLHTATPAVVTNTPRVRVSAEPSVERQPNRPSMARYTCLVVVIHGFRLTVIPRAR